VDYLHESGVSIYRRRRRRRAAVTLTCVILLLLGTAVYAASYVKGWVGAAPPKAAVRLSCTNPALAPGAVTVNVYNATDRAGLAASVAAALERQGFKVASIDNDPLGKTILTVGEIRTGQNGAAGTILVAQRLSGARVVQDDRTDASVDIVLGKVFRALTVPPRAAVPKPARAVPGC